MSEIVVNHPKTAFDYFVLSFCLLVPTIGTLVFVILLDTFSDERLTIGIAACVYLSSAFLGLFKTKRFRQCYGRPEFWALIVGTVLCGVSSMVAAGALILSYAAAGLKIH